MHEIKVLSCSKTTFMRMGSGSSSSFFSLSTQNFSKREERENCDKEEPLEFTATNCQPAMARSTNSSAATCSSGIMGSFSCRIGLPLLLKRQTSRPTQSLDQNFYEKMSPHFYSSNEMQDIVLQSTKEKFIKKWKLQGSIRSNQIDTSNK